MPIYTASDGSLKETSKMNAFNLINGLVKSAREGKEENVEALKEELLTRLCPPTTDKV